VKGTRGKQQDWQAKSGAEELASLKLFQYFCPHLSALNPPPGLSPEVGFSGRFLDAVLAGRLRMSYDDRIEAEYRDPASLFG
jgi:hypothetical protein